MYKIISVSNRRLCGDFISRIKEITAHGTDVILREKDLGENEYEALAREVMCDKIIMHTYIEAARRLCCPRIHLPMPLLRSADISGFEAVGASVHSVREAEEAQALGADYVTAGHIFATDCKKGLPPRGTEFLHKVSQSVSIPVYAIGGINPSNAAEAINAGADGICVMSGLMLCEEIGKYLNEFNSALDTYGCK